MMEEESIFKDLLPDNICIALPEDMDPPSTEQITKELRSCGLYPYMLKRKDQEAKEAAEKEGYVFHFTVLCLKTECYDA